MHVIATAGHVDHGKSTLVRALTGIDPDRFEEEKRRGLTIDLGFAWFTTPAGREVGIVDVPGHERFIGNMLAGVGPITTVLFVVAADEGWKPQSTEHLQILDFLGARGGVVALTKADIGDVERAREAVSDRLRGSCLDGAPIVAVSATTGQGLDDLVDELDNALAEDTATPFVDRPRLFVDRSFTIAGAGTVVTGTLVGGSLAVGDAIEVAPSGHPARIRTIQTHKRSVDVAYPTSRVALNLAGMDKKDVRRGDAIVPPGRWTATKTIAARLDVARGIAHDVGERGAYELYLGTAEVSCRMKTIAPQPEGIVQLFVSHEVVADIGDRFVIRDVGRSETVAGGTVLDQAPRAIKRGDEREIARLRARDGLVGAELASQIVAERGIVASDELARLAWIPRAADAFVVDAAYATALREQAIKAVAAHHHQHPLDVGMPRNALRDALGLTEDSFSHLLQTWDGLVVQGNAVKAVDRINALADAQRTIADRAIAALREAGVAPPRPSEVGLPFDLVKALERAREVVVVSPDIVYPADVWDRIRTDITELISRVGPVTVSQAREALGTSRKYALPVLQKLDALGVTRRNDERRELR